MTSLQRSVYSFARSVASVCISYISSSSMQLIATRHCLCRAVSLQSTATTNTYSYFTHKTHKHIKHMYFVYDSYNNNNNNNTYWQMLMTSKHKTHCAAHCVCFVNLYTVCIVSKRVSYSNIFRVESKYITQFQFSTTTVIICTIDISCRCQSLGTNILWIRVT